VLDLPYLHSAHGRLRSISHISRRAQKRGVAPSADVISFSACKDDETSADTFEGGVAVGAMSHAFIRSLGVSHPFVPAVNTDLFLESVCRKKNPTKRTASSSSSSDISSYLNSGRRHNFRGRILWIWIGSLSCRGKWLGWEVGCTDHDTRRLSDFQQSKSGPISNYIQRQDPWGRVGADPRNTQRAGQIQRWVQSAHMGREWLKRIVLIYSTVTWLVILGLYYQGCYRYQ